MIRACLLLITASSLALASCSNSDDNQAKAPQAMVGSGSKLIEVAPGEKPNAPYWLGPPRRGAYLFLENPVPGSGRLVYAQPDEASMIDSGREPLGAMQVRVQVVPPDDLARQKYFGRKARELRKFVRRTPLGPAYLATSGRQARIPVDGGKRVIIINARDIHLLTNALGLVRATGQK